MVEGERKGIPYRRKSISKGQNAGELFSDALELAHTGVGDPRMLSQLRVVFLACSQPLTDLYLSSGPPLTARVSLQHSIVTSTP